MGGVNLNEELARHPGRCLAADRAMEGQDQAQVGAAECVMCVNPGRHMQIRTGPHQADAEIEMRVVEADDEFLLRPRLQWEGANALSVVGEPRAQPKGGHNDVTQGEKALHPAWKGRRPMGGLFERKQTFDRIAVNEVTIGHPGVKGAFRR